MSSESLKRNEIFVLNLSMHKSFRILIIKSMYLFVTSFEFCMTLCLFRKGNKSSTFCWNGDGVTDHVGLLLDIHV